LRSLAKILLPLALAASAALVLATTGRGEEATGPAFGFTEDATKYANDGGDAYFDLFQDLGVTENRVVVFWNPAQPDVIDEQGFLDRLVPQAQKHGVSLVFAVYSRKASSYTRPGAMDQFAAFAAKVAQTYPSVTQFVVGNEPNQPRFWQPQFSKKDGRVLSAGAYTQLLAKSYDALKAVNPAITVYGVGLSPRGNDKPKARSNSSVSPVRFIKEMGKAYRKIGRRAPLMDALAIHIYPDRNTQPPSKGYFWPGIGFPNLDRLKQAFWDAFHGTAQPLFAEDGTEPSSDETGQSPPPLRVKIDEIGWQVKIGADKKALYHGRENVPVVSEQAQASFYRQVVNYALCDESVEAALLFHLIDEDDLDRFQSGVLTVDGAPRLSYQAVKEAIKQGCQGPAAAWRHHTSVEGARARFPRGLRALRRSPALTLKADEAYAWRAGVIRLPSRSVSVSGPVFKTKVEQILKRPSASKGQFALVTRVQGNGRAYWKTAARLRGLSLGPGRYVFAAVFYAVANPERTTVVVGSPLRIS
jgi:hypothetical protein